MNLHSNRFSRGLLIVSLLIALLSGLSGILTHAQAAPQKQFATGLVLSEFRTLGPAGASDEFIEIYNPTNAALSLNGLKLISSSGCGTTKTTLYTFGAISLDPHKHYLVGGNKYSGPTDVTINLDIADTGGIALTTAADVAIDQVGMCDTTLYKEGTTLASLTGSSDQSYERKGNGCVDANNNVADFSNITPSNPQTSSDLPLSCLTVTGVSSTLPDGTYTYVSNGSFVIPITVTFSDNVNVTGTPTLTLETGLVDGKATYASGSGTNTLTFNYTVQAQDATADLDYQGINALALNGGSIRGAVGDATLTLPIPGTAGSLSANKDIKLDNAVQPSVVSFMRQNPTTRLTNSDTLVFRTTFNEPVTGVDGTDFTVTGAAGTSASAVLVENNVFDITISGGNLASYTGIVGLDLSGTQNIIDTSGYTLLPGEPTSANDQDYLLDNASPSVVVAQAAGQTDPASTPPVNFAVTFSEPIDASTFTVSDIKQNGTLSAAITWVIVDSGDHMNFALSATAIAGNGTLVPSINAAQVKDVAGNDNTASATGPGIDNSVDYADTVPPTVTVNRARPQPSATNTLPIRFVVMFSEPIDTNTFKAVDITQDGTATGITWVIEDTGDHMNFNLTATAVTGKGTLIPSIPASTVKDYAGLNNLASTSTDNIVTYETTSPTVTVNQASGQADPTSILPVRFTILFSEAINPSTFTPADITQVGTATGIAWSIADLGDHKTFTLSVLSVGSTGTLVPSIVAAKVTDLAGNNNVASTSTDNSVTFTGSVVTPTRSPTPTASPTPTLGVVINEVAWMGTKASADDEWVELYNRGSATVDMSGWTLTLRSTVGGAVTHTINITGSVPGGDYYILAPASAFTDVVIDQNMSTPFDNGGNILELRDAAGILIDTANADGGSWPAGIGSPTYATMERHLGNGLDFPFNWYTFAGTTANGRPPLKHDRSNNLVQGTPGYDNWASLVTATPTKSPTPTKAPTHKPGTVVPTASPTVVINEFLPRAGFDWNQDGKVDVYDEFIEIANLGPINVTLTGWKLDDEAGKGSNPYTLPNITLTPGQHLVIYASQSNVLLSDGGDTVRLLNPNNVLKDAQTYSVVKIEDKSWCRLPDINGSWFADCFPTPNQRNTREGTVPSTPPGTGLEEQRCTLPDTLPEDFRSAECFGFGSNMWQSMYWDVTGWLKDFLVPQNESKWETYIE